MVDQVAGHHRPLPAGETTDGAMTRRMSGRRRTERHMLTEPVAGRHNGHLAACGGEGKGRYRVLCLGGARNEEDLRADVGDTSQGDRTIVFYVRLMSV